LVDAVHDGAKSIGILGLSGNDRELRVVGIHVIMDDGLNIEVLIDRSGVLTRKNPNLRATYRELKEGDAQI